MVLAAALLAFTSIDAAAVAALKEAAPLSKRWEYGGVIWEAEGRYYYTVPITTGMPNGVDLSSLIEFGHVVADYHTHPCVGNKPLNNFFSQQDTIVNRGLHHPGYMLSMCDGYIRRWAEDDDEGDEEIHFHSGLVMYLSNGHIVGELP